MSEGKGGDWQPPSQSDWEHVANAVCPRCHDELDTLWWECLRCGFSAKHIASSISPPTPSTDSNGDGR